MKTRKINNIVFVKSLRGKTRPRKHWRKWQIPPDIDGWSQAIQERFLNLTVRTSHIEHDCGMLSIGYHGEFIIEKSIANKLASESRRPMGDDEVTFEFDFGRTIFIEQDKVVVDKIRDDRLMRLLNARKLPQTRTVKVVVFDRNPDVIAEALYRANGLCEECFSPAPFMRASDGSPYLEVHHIIPLADGGEDTIENVVSVCPNCHRRAHFA